MSKETPVLPNPFNSYGYQGYSINDEDGLLAEIFKRLDLKKEPHFAEFGVGNGLQCNTLQFVMQGLKGCWVGNSHLAFKNPDDGSLLHIHQTVSADTINQIVQLIKLNYGTNIGFVGVNYKDNGQHYLTEIMALNPKVLCVYFNPKVLPPAVFCADFDPSAKRNGDNFNASLQHYVNTLDNYKLVVCTSTGSHAIFVRKEYGDLFPEVPQAVTDIFLVPTVYNTNRNAPQASAQTVESYLKKYITPIKNPYQN